MLFESFRFSTTLSEGSASLLPVGIIGIKKEPDASGEVYGETPEARATSDSGISVADLLDRVNAVDGDTLSKKDMGVNADESLDKASLRYNKNNSAVGQEMVQNDRLRNSEGVGNNLHGYNWDEDTIVLGRGGHRGSYSGAVRVQDSEGRTLFPGIVGYHVGIEDCKRCEYYCHSLDTILLYNERVKYDAERSGNRNGENYRRAHREIDEAAHLNETGSSRDIRDSGSHGDDGNAELLSQHIVGEELRHDTGGGLRGIGGNGANLSDSKINSEAPDEGASSASIGVDAFLSRGRYRGNKKRGKYLPRYAGISASKICVTYLPDTVNTVEDV